MFHLQVNQTAVIRWDYGNVQLGTCEETIEGGDHIRYWTQNGPDADTGAVFLALSYEMPIAGTLSGLSPPLPSHMITYRSTQYHREWVSGCDMTRNPTDVARYRYNLGRDWFVGNATAQSSVINTSKDMNGSTYSGSTSFNGYTYHTTATYVSGLLQNTSVGINHYQSVGVNSTNAIDGLVIVMTVKITSQPSTAGRYVPLSPEER